MSKYIEVDALKERIRKKLGIRSLDYLLPIEKEIVKEVDSAPTIDIVHCRECKWSDWYTSIDGNRYCYCMETGASARTDNDFCSYGEREGE